MTSPLMVPAYILVFFSLKLCPATVWFLRRSVVRDRRRRRSDPVPSRRAEHAPSLSETHLLKRPVRFLRRSVGRDRRRRQSDPLPNRRTEHSPTPSKDPSARETEESRSEPRVEPQQGDYILIKVGGRGVCKYSVGQVSHTDENLELAVKFLTPQEKHTFVWPTKAVMRSTDYSEIIKILDEPKKLKRKGCPLRFAFDFTKFALV